MSSSTAPPPRVHTPPPKKNCFVVVLFAYGYDHIMRMGPVYLGGTHIFARFARTPFSKLYILLSQYRGRLHETLHA